VGCLPWGWQLAADGKTLEPCAAELSVIARAKSLRDGGASLAEIAEQLAAEGVRTRGGGRPHKVFVFRLCQFSDAPSTEGAA
jgi:hypothetical protein